MHRSDGKCHNEASLTSGGGVVGECRLSHVLTSWPHLPNVPLATREPGANTACGWSEERAEASPAQ